MSTNKPAVTERQKPRETWCWSRVKRAVSTPHPGTASQLKGGMASSRLHGGTRKMAFCFLGGSRCSESEPKVWCGLSHSQSAWIWNLRGQVQEAPLNIASNNQLTKCLIPISTTGVCWFGDLSPQGRNGAPGVHTMVSRNLNER